MASDELPTFRKIAKEFDHREDDEVDFWIYEAGRAHTAGAWGNVYVMAMCLYAAHNMKMLGLDKTDEELEDVTGLAGPVLARRAGDVSENYGAGGRALQNAGDQELMSTRYGQMYIRLRNTRAAGHAQVIEIPTTAADS